MYFSPAVIVQQLSFELGFFDFLVTELLITDARNSSNYLRIISALMVRWTPTSYVLNPAGVLCIQS